MVAGIETLDLSPTASSTGDLADAKKYANLPVRSFQLDLRPDTQQELLEQGESHTVIADQGDPRTTKSEVPPQTQSLIQDLLKYTEATPKSGG